MRASVTIDLNGFEIVLSGYAPSYLNNEGKPGEGDGWFGGLYGGGSEAFFKLLRDWRAAGDFKGHEFS